MTPQELSLLIPTQNLLRSMKTVLKIFQEGWDLRAEGPPIALSRLRGVPGSFVHDGHHRIVGALLGGFEIPDDKILWKDFDLNEYLEPNPPLWVTPFDPRTQCRLPDIRTFKEEARLRGDLDRWVRSQAHRYLEPRRLHSMAELASQYDFRLAG